MSDILQYLLYNQNYRLFIDFYFKYSVISLVCRPEKFEWLWVNEGKNFQKGSILIQQLWFRIIVRAWLGFLLSFPSKFSAACNSINLATLQKIEKYVRQNPSYVHQKNIWDLLIIRSLAEALWAGYKTEKTEGSKRGVSWKDFCWFFLLS